MEIPHAIGTPRLTTPLGFRQLQIMQHLWTHVAATVCEIRDALNADASLTYTTVMTICVGLYEKGLLKRQLVEQDATRPQGSLCTSTRRCWA